MGTVLTPTAYHTELIDGLEIEKPLPKNLHAFIQTFLIQWFGRELPRQYRVASELNVLCGKDRMVPDVTVVLRNARYLDGDLADPALVAVEILSPGQTIGNLFDKADRIVRAGTPVCWVIWPERRQAWQYTAQELAEAKQQLCASLVGGDAVAVNLSELWEALD